MKGYLTFKFLLNGLVKLFLPHNQELLFSFSVLNFNLTLIT